LFPALGHLEYRSPAFHPFAFDPDLIVCRNYSNGPFVWFVFLLETSSPIQVRVQEFSGAYWLVFVRVQVVWIFDPARKNSFLSMGSLPRGPVPGSILQHYPGNTCRGLRRSRFLY